MTDDPTGPHKAYRKPDFLASRDGRPIRILSEYVKPEARSLAFRLTEWSKGLDGTSRRFVIC